MKLFSKLIFVALIFAVASISSADELYKGWINVSNNGWGDYFRVWYEGVPMYPYAIPINESITFHADSGWCNIEVYTWDVGGPGWHDDADVYVNTGETTYITFERNFRPIEL